MKRVALFAAGLGGAFVAAFAVGQSLDVGARTVAAAHEEETMTTTSGAGHGGGHESAEPGGLAVEQDGYRLEQERDSYTSGSVEPYVFRIVGPDGGTVRDFELEHERRLHLIVAGRSPSKAFLHLHPEQRDDGSWETPLSLPARGSYRVFADFTTGGERRTLGADLVGVDGPEAAAEALTAYDVALDRDAGRLTFHVTEGGKPVEIQPYLGARGHLVVLREGDLAYVHAHADEDELSFDVPFPGEGRYRLYLQFQVGEQVETARFEVDA